MSKYVPKDGCRTIWLKVTSDALELPVAVADTSVELARICGTTAQSIQSSMSNAKHKGIKTPYRKIRVEIDEEEVE